MATSGLEFVTESKQPLIQKIQIDIKEDKKETVIQKIKDLSKEDFQKLKVKGDGNCMVRAIIRSIGEDELKHPELR